MFELWGEDPAVSFCPAARGAARGSRARTGAGCCTRAGGRCGAARRFSVTVRLQKQGPAALSSASMPRSRATAGAAGGPVRHLPGRDRADRGRRADPPSGAARCADGAAQPACVFDDRLGRAVAGARRTGVTAGGALPRPQRFQGRQRHHGPRRRGRAAAAGRPPAGGGDPRLRYRGPARRRRIRGHPGRRRHRRVPPPTSPSACWPNCRCPTGSTARRSMPRPRSASPCWTLARRRPAGAAAAGRPGALCGQSHRPRLLRVLLARHERARCTSANGSRARCAMPPSAARSASSTSRNSACAPAAWSASRA